MSNNSNNYLDNDNTFPKNIIFYNCNSAEIFCNSFFDNLLHDNHIHTKVYCFNEPVIACTGMGIEREIDRDKKSNNKSIDNFIHINDWFHHHVHVTKYTVDGLTRKKQTIYELFEELNVSITPEELIEASNSNDE